MGFFEKVFDGSLAVNRMRNQLLAKSLGDQLRKFEGASKGRRFPEFGTNTNSNNSEINLALPILRQRSRELCRNNPYAKNAPGRLANNIVGTGILATPVDRKNRKAAVKLVKKAWKDWSEKTVCDFNEQLNFGGIQSQVVRSIIKNGEAIIRKHYLPYKNGRINFELQLIDPDFIDTSKDKTGLSESGYILGGIEYDRFGKKQAYHIYDRHPLEFSAKSNRIKKEDIIHVFLPDDPGQNRGLPEFTSIILRMKDFDKYEDAQLTRQIVACCFAAFIQDNDGAALPSTTPIDAEGPIERLESGTIETLGQGKTITFANPPTTENYEEYTRQNLRGQAIGLGMTYEAFTGDLSNVNFSSGRMGWIEFNRNVEYIQWLILVPMFLDRVWEWFLTGAYLAGLIPDTNFDVTWTPPRREMIDPGKEVKALVESIRAGLTTWQDAVRQLGYTPDEIIEELKSDNASFDAAGLVLTSDPRQDPERINANNKKVKPAA